MGIFREENNLVTSMNVVETRFINYFVSKMILPLSKEAMHKRKQRTLAEVNCHLAPGSRPRKGNEKSNVFRGKNILYYFLKWAKTV